MRRNARIATSAVLALTAGLAAPARADLVSDQVPRVGVGAAIFTWEPESAKQPDALVLGHVRVFVVGPLALQADVGYWRSAATGTTVEGWTAKRSARDVPVAASMLLFARATPAFALYVGAGFVRHDWLLTRQTYMPGETVETSARSSDVGGQIVAGVELRVGPGLGLSGEGRWQIGAIPGFPGDPETWDYSGPSAGLGVNLYVR